MEVFVDSKISQLPDEIYNTNYGQKFIAYLDNSPARYNHRTAEC